MRALLLPLSYTGIVVKEWLPLTDSNHDHRIQSAASCRWTKGDRWCSLTVSIRLLQLERLRSERLGGGSGPTSDARERCHAAVVVTPMPCSRDKKRAPEGQTISAERQ